MNSATFARSYHTDLGGLSRRPLRGGIPDAGGSFDGLAAYSLQALRGTLRRMWIRIVATILAHFLFNTVSYIAGFAT